MSRKRRHINARDDEWIVVHRPLSGGESSGSSCGCIVLAIIVLIALSRCS